MRITSSGAQLFEGDGTLYDMTRGSILHGIDLFCFFFLFGCWRFIRNSFTNNTNL
jgi:hypothetical protein